MVVCSRPYIGSNERLSGIRRGRHKRQKYIKGVTIEPDRKSRKRKSNQGSTNRIGEQNKVEKRKHERKDLMYTSILLHAQPLQNNNL